MTCGWAWNWIVRRKIGADSCQHFASGIFLRMENIMFIGVKIVEAVPMTRETFEALHGRNVGGDKMGDGYEVEYDNGYKAWSPKDVFDAAYRATNGMTFGLTIEALRMGKKAARAGWNGKGIHIELQVPDTHSKMSSPYIFIDTTGLQTSNPDAPKSRVPWLASQTDMLAEDWQIVEFPWVSKRVAIQKEKIEALKQPQRGLTA